MRLGARDSVVHFPHHLTIVVALLVMVSLGIVKPVQADPPPWAPAHGYRGKQKHKYKHNDHEYREGMYEDYGETPDFGIHGGHCNREAVVGLLGGAVGGVVGSRIGKGDGKVVATAVGTLLGYIIGSNIGRGMDEADRYCTGQVLEYADNGQTVNWTNPDLNTAYHVTPLTAYESEGRRCRDYTTREVVKGVVRKAKVAACRQSDGSWRIINR